MILEQGIIALIQLILKLFPALLRDLFACLIQKAEAWVEDTPPVVPFPFSENDPDCVIGTAGNYQVIVDPGGKPGALEGEACGVGHLLLGQKLAGDRFQAAFVSGKPAGDGLLAVCAFRQPGLDVI